MLTQPPRANRSLRVMTSFPGEQYGAGAAVATRFFLLILRPVVDALLLILRQGDPPVVNP